MFAFTAEGTVPRPSQPGAIYIDLLEAALGERQSSLGRLSASEALAQVLRHRRDLVGEGADDRGWAAAALADQVAYDSALIAYARRVGLSAIHDGSETRGSSAGASREPSGTGEFPSTSRAPSLSGGAGPGRGPASTDESGPRGVPTAEVGRTLCDPGGIAGRLGPALHSELGQQVGHVVLHRLLGQEELVGDLAIGLPSAMRSRMRRSCGVRPASSGSSSAPSRSRLEHPSVSAGSSSDCPSATRPDVAHQV